MASGKKNTVLKPKDLYRALTGKIAELRQPEIFPRKSLKGLTLVLFWREMLLGAVDAALLDSLLPADKTHPRVQSSLMNRTGASPMPQSLRRALLPDAQMLLKMTENAGRFLRRYTYVPDHFSAVMNAFEDMCAEQDFFMTKAARRFLNNIRLWSESSAHGAEASQLFCDAYRLAALALLSLYGPLMGCNEMNALLTDENASPTCMHAAWRRMQRRSLQPRVISAGDCDICREALGGGEYVPLSLTPQQLAEEIERGGKLLLSGVGGSGKTELTRQSLERLFQWETFERIAFVQYDSSLPQSYLRAFPELAEEGEENIAEAVRRLLEDPEGGRTLMVIDGMNAAEEDDQAVRQLSAYECDVLVTSRMNRLTGFAVMQTPPAQAEEAGRIFGFHADLSVQKEEAEALCRITAGHPLALTLLGRLCRQRCWQAQELIGKLSGEEVSLAGLLEGLYSGFVPEGREGQLLRIFAALSEERRLPKNLLALTADITQDEHELAALLLRLFEQGWLTHTEEGYAMHPILRACLGAKRCECSRLPLLWKRLAGIMDGEDLQEKQSIVGDAIRLLISMDEWNSDAASCAAGIELSQQTRGASELLPALLRKHRQYIEQCVHTRQEEIDMYLGQMMVGYVSGKTDGIPAAVEALAQFEREELLAFSRYPTLLNLLECVSSLAEEKPVCALFDRLRPEDEQGRKMIAYLNFYGGYIRQLRTDTPRAVELLEQGRRLIEQNALFGSIEEVANDTRMAYALADMQRFDDTLPLMRKVLDNLRWRGYSEDSSTVTATRNSYLFFLGKAEKTQASIRGYTENLQTMEARGETEQLEYLLALNMYVHLLSDLTQWKEAEGIAEQMVKLVRRHPEFAPIHTGRALYNAGRVLIHAGRPSEGIGLLDEALLLRGELRSIENCVIEATRAEAYALLGRTEHARSLLEHAFGEAEEKYIESIQCMDFARYLLRRLKEQ